MRSLGRPLSRSRSFSLGGRSPDCVVVLRSVPSPAKQVVSMVTMVSSHFVCVCVFPLSLTCVCVSIPTEGLLRSSVTPVPSMVSMSRGSALLWDDPLHNIVIRPAPVPLAPPRPAVAQGGGRAFHGTVVCDGLGDRKSTRLNSSHL